jgi:hypothetical protein
VNELEPLAPFVKVKPVVEPSVTVPFNTDTVSESGLPPDEASVTLISLPLTDENVTAKFTVTLALEGALIVGGPTLMATVAEPDKLFPPSTTEMESESGPA